MKSTKSPGSTVDLTVAFPDLGLTQKQLNALKKTFKDLVVTTLLATGKKLPKQNPSITHRPSIKRH
jgi:hypothetical protein